MVGVMARQRIQDIAVVLVILGVCVSGCTRLRENAPRDEVVRYLAAFSLELPANATNMSYFMQKGRDLHFWLRFEVPLSERDNVLSEMGFSRAAFEWEPGIPIRLDQLDSVGFDLIVHRRGMDWWQPSQVANARCADMTDADIVRFAVVGIDDGVCVVYFEGGT
jgi:hypothetical protein